MNYGARPEPATASEAASELFTVLLNIIILQFAGYQFKASGALTHEMQGGIQLFAGHLALPAMFFGALATLDVWAIDTAVLIAVLIGKLSMVLISIGLGLAAQQFVSRMSPGVAFLRSGIFSLLVTNGDELGLGLPAMGAIFEPKLIGMLYVLAGFQEMLFNPIAFLILGVGAAHRDAANAANAANAAKAHDGKGDAAEAERSHAHAPSMLAVLRAVLRHELQNPLVIAILAGLAFNLSFAGLTGAELPTILRRATETLGDGFPPCIFFLMGASSYGTFSKLAALENVPLPLTMVCLKSFILPPLIRGLALAFGAVGNAVDFCFAYGMLPAAGSSLVIAYKYLPPAAQMDMLNAALALSKLVSFPLLLLVSSVLFLRDAAAISVAAAQLGLPLQMLSLLLCALALISSNGCCRAEPRTHPTIQLLLGLECAFLLVSLAVELLRSFGGSSRGELISWLPPVVEFIISSTIRWAVDAQTLAIAAFHLSHLAELAQVDRNGAERGRPSRSTAATMAAQHYAPLEDATSEVEFDNDSDAASAGGRECSVPNSPVPHAPLHNNAMCLAATSTTIGLGMTLPWSLRASERTSASTGSFDSFDAFWIPYGRGQAKVYSLAYAIAAATGLGALVAIMRRDSELRLSERNRAYHGFLQRLELLLIAIVARLTLSAATCASAAAAEAASAASFQPTGTVAIMLLLVTGLNGALGCLLFLLFGWDAVSNDVGRLVRAWRPTTLTLS